MNLPMKNCRLVNKCMFGRGSGPRDGEVGAIYGVFGVPKKGRGGARCLEPRRHPTGRDRF